MALSTYAFGLACGKVLHGQRIIKTDEIMTSRQKIYLYEHMFMPGVLPIQPLDSLQGPGL